MTPPPTPPTDASALLDVYAPFDIAFSHGEGMWLHTADGRKLLDFAAGLATLTLGHSHPHLINAITQQAQKLIHVSNLFRIPQQERLAQRLTAASFAERVFFTNSGSEAIECAIKMARAFHNHHNNPHRHTLIAFDNAFHGRTLAALAAGGQPKHLNGFEPHMPGFTHVPFPDATAAANAITPQTAGILVEPVQGEGGIRVVPHEILQQLRTLCDQHTILLILDEVQCGNGRTGTLFAHEHASITPDILATAKGLGGGFPLGACLATEHAAKGMKPGSHGSTYGGNPLAMAAGNAILDQLLDHNLIANAARTGITLKQSLAALADSHPNVIVESRGVGLMTGLKLHSAIPARDFVLAALDAGLLTVPAGDNVVRLLPPLIVEDEHIRHAIDILDTVCAHPPAPATP